MQRQFGIKMIIVDYLQLMHSNSRNIQNREQEVADISKGLKALAKSLHVPVIALSQLNRAVDSRTVKQPVLSDIRESGSIEQDADKIIFIHREDYYNPNSQPTNEAEIIIAKQRNGPTGIVKLHWEGQYTRFSNLEHNDNYF
jgi:replicative DNA helicase